MRKVFKYELLIQDECNVFMPEGSEILHVGNQYEKMCVWALVDASRRDELRYFRIAGTGHALPDVDLKHLGSAQFAGGALVFHVFERVT
jgi:hypothetical protein